MVSVTLGKTWKCKNIITQETKDKIYTIDRNNKISKKLSKSVLQYDLEGNFIKEWSSVTEARKQTNISKIDKVARGEGKTSGGFRWKYKN
jgi:nucleosome binding factor SPN SPT16 subunit